MPNGKEDNTMLDLTLARQIYKDVNETKCQDQVTITLLEARCFTLIASDGREVYALQKGNTTILYWVTFARVKFVDITT